MKPLRKLDLKQYFTDAEHISALMCQLLGSVDGLSVLEPSVGQGALIKGLLGVPARIDAVDVDASALDVVRRTSPQDNLNLYHCDFIEIVSNNTILDKHQVLENYYDAVISNPPYGLPFTVEYRKYLKKIYPHLYVKESYGLFFIFSVSQLKQDGKYVFLIPDTFLTSKNHTPLREFICSNGAPTHIIRFPSKKFETVNFCYGNLCIIAGNKKKLESSDKVLWLDSSDPKLDVFLSMVNVPNEVEGNYLLDNISSGWSSVGMANRPNGQSEWPTLGGLAECRTGIYTGDNVKFIGYDPGRVKRRLNGHPIEWNKVVIKDTLSKDEEINGIVHDSYYVPLVRGGHRECFEEPASAINWSCAALNFYKTNKKARFQNTKYYFAEGLSVPMVSSGRISASLMNNAVFDQGVVGIFPRDKRLIAPLLLYFNSTFASKLMKGMVNGSANNSANYLKKLPVPAFTQSQIVKASTILENARLAGSMQYDKCDIYIDEVIKEFTNSNKLLS